MYLRVAHHHGQPRLERYWKPLYYYESVKCKVTTSIRGFQNIQIRRKKNMTGTRDFKTGKCQREIVLDRRRPDFVKIYFLENVG